MTTLIDDPLIAAMSIERVLPLHESSRRLRELYPQCPRVYGVAVLSDFDIIVAAGGANKAIARIFTATADAGGNITIAFTSIVNNAKVSAITITPA